MPKLPAGQQGLSNSSQSNYPLKEARREEQKTPATEASRRNPPPNSLKSEVRPASDRYDSKPAEKEGKSNTRPVEVGNAWGNYPHNSLADLPNRSASGPTLGNNLSGDQFGEVSVREGAPKAKPLDGYSEEGRNDHIR